MIKYVFFDVSGTLLTKPSLIHKIDEILLEHGYSIPLHEIKHKHKFISELIHFPDRTDVDFYKKFNSELLQSFGIVPDGLLLNEIFKRCSYLPWEKFSDTVILNELEIPLGIISNFNNTLKEKLDLFFGPIFSDVLVSEELGVSKPNLEFYKRAVDKIGMSTSEILYIGDSFKLDIEPALKLGIKSLLIDRDCFYPGSEFRIGSLSELMNFI